MLSNRQMNLLIENVLRRMHGAPIFDQKMNSLEVPRLMGVPTEDPHVMDIIKEDIKAVIASLERQLKIWLYPRRKTDLPKTPEELYMRRQKYALKGAFRQHNYDRLYNFPLWNDLLPQQKTKWLELNPQDLPDGGIPVSDEDWYNQWRIKSPLPWHFLTTQQQKFFTRNVNYALNKVGWAERLDGKNRKYIKFYEKDVLDIHSIRLEMKGFLNGGLTPFYQRTFNENEYVLYPEDGAILLFPAFAALQAITNNGGGVTATNMGSTIPPMPQIIVVDYTFGFVEIPDDLREAIAMLVACKSFQTINIAETQGLLSFSVQGFSAQFGDGLYAKVIDYYTKEAEKIIYNGGYSAGPLMTAW